MCILIRKQVTHRLKTLAKGKTKVRIISLRGFHKFQARLGSKKTLKIFAISFEISKKNLHIRLTFSRGSTMIVNKMSTILGPETSGC